MATPIKLNALLTLKGDVPTKFVIGQEYTIHKDGFRILPFNIPMEFADSNHKYLGKIKVVKLVITPEGSDITFRVLKLFSPPERELYSSNFIKL